MVLVPGPVFNNDERDQYVREEEEFAAWMEDQQVGEDDTNGETDSEEGDVSLSFTCNREE